MWLRKSGYVLDRGSAPVIGVLGSLGTAFLFAIAFLTTIDVFLRLVFRAPIKGVYELTEVMMIILVYLALAWAQRNKVNIRVDLFVKNFQPRAQAATDAFTTICSLFIVGMIAWQGFDFALYLASHNRTYDVLRIPVAPFEIVLVVGCVMLCVVFLTDILNYLAEALSR